MSPPVQALVRVDQHTTALLAHLRASTGRPVGSAVAPGGLDLDTYCVLYRLPGVRDGSMSRPDDDGILTYQVTCVGKDAAGAEWMAAQVEDAMLGPVRPAIPGRLVMRIELLDDGQVQRDEDVTPHLFYATPRYRLRSTPSS